MGGRGAVVVARPAAAAAAADLTMYIARETSKVSLALDSIPEAALLVPLVGAWFSFDGAVWGDLCRYGGR